MQNTNKINEEYYKKINLDLTEIVENEVGKDYICYDVYNKKDKRIFQSLERKSDFEVLAYSEDEDEFIKLVQTISDLKLL